MRIKTKELKVMEKAGGKILEVAVSGRLEKEDYTSFAPEIDRLVEEHGKIRVLVVLHDFHGWTAGALWEDVKVDVKHFNHIERLAIVGETAWQKGMAVFCKPFTTAKIRYFDIKNADQAREWIAEGMSAE